MTIYSFFGKVPPDWKPLPVDVKRIVDERVDITSDVLRNELKHPVTDQKITIIQYEYNDLIKTISSSIDADLYQCCVNIFDTIETTDMFDFFPLRENRIKIKDYIADTLSIYFNKKITISVLNDNTISEHYTVNDDNITLYINKIHATGLESKRRNVVIRTQKFYYTILHYCKYFEKINFDIYIDKNVRIDTYLTSYLYYTPFKLFLILTRLLGHLEKKNQVDLVSFFKDICEKDNSDETVDIQYFLFHDKTITQ